MRARLFLGALLVASVALNAWLISRDAPTVARGSAVSTPARAVPAPSQAAAGIADRAPSPAAPGDAEARIAELERRAATLRVELRRHEPMDQQFREGEPDPAAAERLRPDLGRVLGDAKIGFDLECRSAICHVVAHVPAGASTVWSDAMERLQNDPAAQRLTEGWGFLGGRPVPGSSSDDEDAYAFMRDPKVAYGLDLVQGVVAAFKASTALSDCTAGYRDRGAFAFRVKLTDEAGWDVKGGGTLGATQAGRCLLARLAALASGTAVPHPVSGAVVFGELESPPGGNAP